MDEACRQTCGKPSSRLSRLRRIPEGSLQRHLLQTWTGTKGRRALFPIVGTVRCWRSLHGPRHRPSGTGLSSAIMAAPLVAAPSTCAPGHLAAQHARAMRRRTLDCGSDCAPMGHRHSASHRGRTHGYVVSAASEFQAAPPARAYTGRPEVHGPMRLVDDGGPTATCCHAACRTRLSGAEVTSPMEGVTGMMARLRHVPGCSRGGLYGPANIDFRFV